MNFLKKQLSIWIAWLSNSFLTFIPRWQVNAIISTVLIIGFSACEDPATQIGAELIKLEENISTNFTDTITVKSSTVLLDSIITSGNDKLLVGKYNDPIFGPAIAQTYFQVTAFDSIKANENTILDSVVLNLGYKYYLGDTTQPQTISVHRVLEKIGQNTGSLTKRLLESLDSRNTYFINDKMSYDPTPLGITTNFLPRPVIKKRKTESEVDSMRSLTIRLNESFGKELLSLSGKKAGAGFVDFKEYFKGIALVPGANNTAMLGFEPANRPTSLRLKPSYLGLYYHTKDKKDTLRNFFLASLSDNSTYNNRFNQIQYDKSGTNMSKLLNANDAIPPQGGNGEVYIQSTSGISNKLEFPYLKNLVKNGNIAINKVELIMQPIKLIEGTLPTIALNLVPVNPLDKKRPLRTPAGDLATLNFRSGVPYVPYNITRNEYFFEVTDYFQAILAGKLENNGLFVTAERDYRINRAVFDKSSIKLRVFYSKLGK